MKVVVVIGRGEIFEFDLFFESDKAEAKMFGEWKEPAIC